MYDLETWNKLIRTPDGGGLVHKWWDGGGPRDLMGTTSNSGLGEG